MSSTVAERWQQIRAEIVPCKYAPVLRTVNGCGVTLLGLQREVPGTRIYLKGYWLTFLFLPMIPLRFYLVSGERSGYRFYGSISVFAFVRLYRLRSLTYFLTALLEAAFLILCLVAVLFAAAGVMRLFS